jgi:hypothetical protein
MKNKTRIKRLNPVEPCYRAGLNGNLYAFCNTRAPLVPICQAIGKSTEAIYYNPKYEVWEIRVRAQHHKNKMREYFGKAPMQEQLERQIDIFEFLEGGSEADV